MRCESCGHESAKEARYCANCGKPLEDSGAPARKRGRHSALVAVIAVLLALALSLAALAPRGCASEDAEARIMESMKEANGGILPELAYKEDDLVSIDGTFSSVRVLSQDDALSAIAEVAPLFGVYSPVKELDFRIEERDEQAGTVTYVFAVLSEEGGGQGEHETEKGSHAEQESETDPDEIQTGAELSREQEIVVTVDKDGIVHKAERRIVSEIEAEEDEIIDDGDVYAAYAVKLKEYIEQYGSPRVVTGGSTWSVSGDGVCLAELIDFDGDSLEELYLAYYDSDKESTEYSWTGHDSNAYVIEVWSFVDHSACVSFQGKGTISNQQGLASCGRMIIKSNNEFGNESTVSWIHTSGYLSGNNYSSELWSIKGGTSSLEHKWEIVGEGTSEVKWVLDNEETELNESEWQDSLNCEYKSYRLMDFVDDERVTECIELTEQTMETLGIMESDQEGDESQQIQAIEREAGQTLVWHQTADFDGDGTEETFGLTGESISDYRNGYWRDSELWYASSTGGTQCLGGFGANVYVNEVFSDPAGSGYEFLSLEVTAGGSGSSSKVFTVRNGIPKEIIVSGCIVKRRGTRIVMAKSFFKDGGGHMHEWYEMRFNQPLFELEEVSMLGVTELGAEPEF